MASHVVRPHGEEFSVLLSIVSMPVMVIPLPSRLSNFTFDAELPSRLILEELSTPDLLNLRLTCDAVKDLVDEKALTTLFLSFPPTNGQATPRSQEAFARIARHCRGMALDVRCAAPSVTINYGPKLEEYLCHLENMTHLYVYIHPDTSACTSATLHDEWKWCSPHFPSTQFEPLKKLRTILENANLNSLEHLSFSPLSIAGVRALRWGPVSGFGEEHGDAGTWMSKRFWSTIKSLTIQMVSW